MSQPLNLIQSAGSGTRLADWQASQCLAEVPPISLDELLPAGSRLAVVAPHPDDEVLGCGGLLAQLAERNVPVGLIAVTDGEASHPGSRVWPGHLLRRERIRESQKALSRLGFDRHAVEWTRLGFADSGVAQEEFLLVERLAKLLSGYTHVISTWQQDGHCDHETVGRATARAARASQVRLYEMPIWAWHWATPNDPRIPWHRARKLPLAGSALVRKQAAIREHRSQLAADPSTGAAPVLSETTLARLAQAHEVYFL